MKKPRVGVTDHAVVRYLERVGGFDIERLRREIGMRVSEGYAVGASCVVIDGTAFIIQGGQVVTVMDASSMLTHVRPVQS